MSNQFIEDLTKLASINRSFISKYQDVDLNEYALGAKTKYSTVQQIDMDKGAKIKRGLGR